jgi:transcriptional regulator with XRE-family HTH domain
MTTSDWPSSRTARARLIREAVATNLRRERKRAGFTHAELETASGVPRNTISEIERAKRSTALTTLDPLAIALQVPLADLLIDLPGLPSRQTGS